MHQKFNPARAIEASAVLARCEGKRIGRLRLLKLLYIADRQAIKRCGQPLLGSKAVAMDHGPLHSDVYDMIKGSHPSSPQWSRFFTEVNPRDMRLTREPENLALSRQDIEILTEVAETHQHLNDWELSKLTHGFDEWRLSSQQGTSVPIDLEDIARGVGRSDDVECIKQDAVDNAAYDKFFERHFE